VRPLRSVVVVSLTALLLLATAGCAPASDTPVLRLAAPAPDTRVAPGEPVELRVVAEHPEDSEVTVSWDLGDGTTATGERPPLHRYERAGTYLITVSGVDDQGRSAVSQTRIVQVGDPPAATGNFALRFHGTGRDDVDRVKIPLRDADDRSNGVNVGAGDATVEFWMRARAGDNTAGPITCGDEPSWVNGNIIVDRDRFNQGRTYGISMGGGLLAVGVGAAENITICGRTRVDDDRWHHVAVTRVAETGAITLFVDGKTDASVVDGPAGDISYPAAAVPEPACDGNRPCTRSDPFLVLGAEKHDVGPEYPSFRGVLDELRLSRVVRYAEPFTPPTVAFVPDEATGALYHFDEATGPVARNSVGSSHGADDGVLRIGGVSAGPVWVPSDAPTGRR
jgi:PKD repeat protein